jgi:hypothetical protein
VPPVVREHALRGSGAALGAGSAGALGDGLSRRLGALPAASVETLGLGGLCLTELAPRLRHLGVLIFARKGQPTSLEAYSFDDDPIVTWPPSDQIAVRMRDQ